MCEVWIFPSDVDAQNVISIEPVAMMNVTSSVAVAHQYLQLRRHPWHSPACSCCATLCAEAHGKSCVKAILQQNLRVVPHFPLQRRLVYF